MKRLLKSILPSSRPRGGMRTSPTKEVTILPKAAPMMIPIAMSSTLPFMANSLNSLSIANPLSFSSVDRTDLVARRMHLACEALDITLLQPLRQRPERGMRRLAKCEGERPRIGSRYEGALIDCKGARREGFLR